MLDWILEQQDVWQRLQSCRKPVVLYGMGDGAVKILRVMEQYGIRPAALFASDDFARGNLFMGYKVEKLRDIQARYDDFIIVMAFAVRDLPTVQRIRSLSQQIELVAPDVPVAGINLFTLDFVRQHEQEFARVESMLADEQSKKVLHNIVNFKLSGKLDYLFDCETPVEEAYQNILRPTDHEHFADLGAYRGDTIAELLHFAGGCERVFAFEPDEKTHKKLCLAVEQMALPGGLPACRWRPIPTSRRWNLTAGAAGSPPCGRSRWSPALRARQSRRSSWCRASRWTMWRGRRRSPSSTWTSRERSGRRWRAAQRSSPATAPRCSSPPTTAARTCLPSRCRLPPCGRTTVFICGTILTSLPGTPTFIVYSNRNGRAAGAHFRA